MDFSGIAARIQQNNQAFFLMKFFRNSALLKELAGIKKLGGTKLTIAELSQLLPDAECFSKVYREVKTAQEKVETLLGKLWNNGTVDWKALNLIWEQTENILKQIGDIAGNNSERKNKIREKTAIAPSERRKDFRQRFSGARADQFSIAGLE